MRVDFVITEMFMGGAEKCLTELAMGMSQRGDDVRIFSLGSFPTGDQAVLLDRLDGAGVRIDSAESDGLMALPRAISRLNRWLKSSPPELVQTFLFHANVIGTRAAKSSVGCPVVGGLRVSDPSRWRKMVERRAVANMDRLVCVSEATSRFAETSFNCSDDKRIVIPNAVHVDRWSTIAPIDWSSIGWPADSVVTLFVGRLIEQKNLGVLQRHIDSIAPPNSNRRLVLIGDGPQRESLLGWAETIGRDRVQILPWQSDVAPLMRAARVLVLPSLYEGMPNVVLEGMAAGIPVVTSRVEGSQELIGESQDDQSFDLSDEPGFVARVNRFQSDVDFASKIGKANQDRMRNQFSVDTMVDRYRALYQELL